MASLPRKAGYLLSTRIVRIFLAMAVPFALAACQQTYLPAGEELSFKHYSPIEIDVATVDVVDEYRAPLAKPNVEHLFRTPPAEAMRIWIADRVRPVGGERRLEVIIKDAGVIEVPLPRTQGIKGTFTKDQSERYDAKLEVEMRIYGSRSALSEASIHVTATRGRTIAENASVAAREQLFDRITRELMEAMNAELEKNIFAYFGNYVHFSGSRR